jgi:hypothetical protein
MLSPDRHTWKEDKPVPARLIIDRAALAFAETGSSLSNLDPAQTRTPLGQTLAPGAELQPRTAAAPGPLEPSSSNSDLARLLPRLSRRARRKDRLPLLPLQETFWLLHRWQGQVLSVGPSSFDVALFDPSDPSLIEGATFQKTELSPENLKLLRPGAVFYWFVGLRDFPDGHRQRESRIWMKRGGRMEKNKYLKELSEVRRLWGAIDWSRPDSPATAR